MPHDKNGNILNVGDEVLLRCKITNVNPGETQCNVTAEAVERPEGEGYIPTIAGNSRFYEKSARPVGFDTPLSKDEVVANKQLRVSIDIEIQRLKSLPPSRERSLAITKLQEAVMWLGMDLKRLGEANPYPNSKDPSNTKIEPTADGLKL